MKIGFIGLGTMGHPMAQNIMKQGHSMVVYNRNPEKTRSFENKAQIAATPVEVAEQSDIIVTMLSDNHAVEDVYFGKNGISVPMRNGTSQVRTVIDSSTISPDLSISIADRLKSFSVHFLDAPVTGSKPQAIEGTLTFMVGGNKQVFEECEELLLSMGKSAVYMGGHGSGSYSKLANNTLCAINLLGVAESIRMVQEAGVDPETFLKAVSGGGARSGMAEMKGPSMIKKDFSANFMVKLMRKDLRLAMDLNQSLHLHTPLLETSYKQFESACNEGLGEEDMSAVYKLYTTT